MQFDNLVQAALRALPYRTAFGLARYLAIDIAGEPHAPLHRNDRRWEAVQGLGGPGNGAPALLGPRGQRR